VKTRASGHPAPGDRIRLRSSSLALLPLVLMSTPLACTTISSPPIFPAPFQIIAHRGASAYAPENTLPAFEKALELGAFEVELDVQLSRDAGVIVFHDQTLDKKTSASGPVASHSLAALERIEIGSWFDRNHSHIVAGGRRYTGTRVVSLRKVFKHFGGRLFYHVELKSPDVDLPMKTLDLIKAAGLLERVRITSFQLEQLQRTRGLNDEIPICLLVRDKKRLRKDARKGDVTLLAQQKRWINRARRESFDQVGFPAEEITQELVAFARKRGLLLRAYRVSGDEDMEHAIRSGVHGMTTNWPDRLIRRMVEEMGSRGDIAAARARRR